MYGFPLDHLQRLVVILHSDMFAVYICMELLKFKHTERHSLSMLAYMVSTAVKVLLEKAIGLLFWRSAALRPYSLALVCRTRGCVWS